MDRKELTTLCLSAFGTDEKDFSLVDDDVAFANSNRTEDEDTSTWLKTGANNNHVCDNDAASVVVSRTAMPKSTSVSLTPIFNTTDEIDLSVYASPDDDYDEDMTEEDDCSEIDENEERDYSAMDKED
ncbi:hypothetical protein H2200_010000 [Cladophialophora chaetospira]|uniref:Uncharacterized protein n=1 Tax=Cladophialophora chaetospira TaxID=386627 RepID=A0AA38X200_9EURO|nr:hypothetical protein H2200_010000 [Cladophialophora chaetospira]